MSWTVEYAREKGVVEVTATGEIRDDDAAAQAAETIQLLGHNRITGVLVDYSDAVSEVSLSKLYWLPDYASEIGAPWDTRIAVVLPRKRYRLESYQFFELVSRNAGYEVKLFESKEAAEDYLAQTAPVREHAEPPAQH